MSLSLSLYIYIYVYIPIMSYRYFPVVVVSRGDLNKFPRNPHFRVDATPGQGRQPWASEAALRGDTVNQTFMDLGLCPAQKDSTRLTIQSPPIHTTQF